MEQTKKDISRRMCYKMYETEKTILLCIKTSKDNYYTLDLCDFSIIFQNGIVVFCLNKDLDIKIKNKKDDVKYFSLDVTNDPKTHNKFNVTNLGYYSIRLTSENGEMFKHSNKTFFVFNVKDFNIHFNFPIYLTEVNEHNFYNQFNYDNKDMVLDFKFKKYNYLFDLNIYKENNYKKINFNFLSLDNTYKVITTGTKNIKVKINKLLN